MISSSAQAKNTPRSWLSPSVSLLPGTPSPQPLVLPMNRDEMSALGWKELDVLLVSGDGYVDHPSFGVALLGRLLVAHGFRVGIITQPPWEDKDQAVAALSVMGRPRLFAGVTAGAIDSLLAHYTAFRKKRSDDAYTPGGQAGARPNRATIVYTNLVRQAFADIPVVLGGIEASLRRIVHYDFWADSLRRPLLCDSKADLLSYGMGEYSLLAIAKTAEELLRTPDDTEDETNAGKKLSFRRRLVTACRMLPGVASLASGPVETVMRTLPESDSLTIPSFEEISASAPLLMQATLLLEKSVHQGDAFLLQGCGDRTLVVAPPAPLLTEKELDFLYSLPFSRLPHPQYTQPIPAWEMIRTSITTHRGCGGGCSFCSLALHQGRRIASRSKQSILNEAKMIAAGPVGEKKTPRWAGAISDVGGPSANMWQAVCAKKDTASCERTSCLYPKICPLFKVDQSRGVTLLRDVAATEGVRHVRIASGVRFDLALQDDAALFAYTSEFTGGQLKVAPEHCAAQVLDLMRKPPMTVFEEFLQKFARHTRQSDKELYTVPYLMSAFPGCTKQHMQALAAWLAEKNWQPQQVQCFIPTPGTVATAMFYTGLTPEGMPLYVARSDNERLKQHHLLFPHHHAHGKAPSRLPGSRHAVEHRKNHHSKSRPPQDRPHGKTAPTRHKNGAKSPGSKK